ncbi:hypothetical protein DFH07DRAFT_368136 [Mycena maculata]|uniref:F-box domain-containing protein n=1 Tax=Mycena maculata TaxID=230809 RepID=A0AAD7JMF5_9AGAR|nr:hypothetical protein DFH07DRAFT_368136 [Mycena maculata]
MHSALLLDDVLRQIFDFCPTNCLPAAARSCKAWSDPAFDGIWCHIGSVIPLLNLIPGLVCVDGVYDLDSEVPLDLTIFNSYASRIKHITQRHNTRVHPSLLSILSKPGNAILNKLASTRLSSIDLHCIPAALSLSPSLRQLDLDLGFRNRRSSDGSSDYIEQLLSVATSLERVRLRGTASHRLNIGIAQMSNLRSLSLRTGTFLTGDTLVAISTFPRLSELDIEAGHLDVGGLTTAWSAPAPDAGYFQSLQKLHVCGQAPLLELLLRTIHPASLRTLRIEATASSSETAVYWNSICDLIKDNASQTLEDLTIEQHLDDLDLDTIHDASDTTAPHPSTQTNRITFDIIRTFAPLRRLRKLTIDMTRIPSLSDQDIEALATWWPDLTHLDLGSLHSSECIPSAGTPRATLACLRAFASSMPMLQTLILPLSIADVPPPSSSPSTSSSALSSATFSSSGPPSDPAAMSLYLHGLFPQLTGVEGTAQHEAAWGEVQALLRDLAH